MTLEIIGFTFLVLGLAVVDGLLLFRVGDLERRVLLLEHDARIKGFE